MGSGSCVVRRRSVSRVRAFAGKPPLVGTQELQYSAYKYNLQSLIKCIQKILIRTWSAPTTNSTIIILYYFVIKTRNHHVTRSCTPLEPSTSCTAYRTLVQHYDVAFGNCRQVRD
jgi:hypothetical protein